MLCNVLCKTMLSLAKGTSRQASNVDLEELGCVGSARTQSRWRCPCATHFHETVTAGEIVDMKELGVWEPYEVKTQTIKTAVESAMLLLRIDDIVSGIQKKDKMAPGQSKPAGAQTEDPDQARRHTWLLHVLAFCGINCSLCGIPAPQARQRAERASQPSTVLHQYASPSLVHG